MSEEQVVRNCAPTLAGLKTGNLFACPYENREDLLDFLRSLNRRLGNAALTIAGIMLFREGAARALAYRGYFAVGGEVFALFLPVFYYCLSRTVRDLITDIKNGFKPEYEED